MSPDEVSFSKGERMKIVRDADDYGWFIVEKIDGTEGLAPLSHLNEDKPEGQGPYGQVRYAESAPVSFEESSDFPLNQELLGCGNQMRIFALFLLCDALSLSGAVGSRAGVRGEGDLRVQGAEQGRAVLHGGRQNEGYEQKNQLISNRKIDSFQTLSRPDWLFRAS